MIPHQLRSFENYNIFDDLFYIRIIIIKIKILDILYNLFFDKESAYVKALYKRKDRKINSINTSLSNEINLDEQANFDNTIEARKVEKIISRESRLISK